MVDIVTRAGKGSPLTNAEIDQTLLNLKAAVEAAALTATWASITSKPTTLSGYGITDALSLSGGTLSGGLTVTGNLLLAANSGSSRTVGFSGGTNTTLVLQAGGATGSGANLELTSDAFAYLDATETRIRSLDGATQFVRITSTATNVVTGALQQGGNQVLHAANYNSYSPTLTGTGASGTWDISVSGNADTATTLQTACTINGVSFNGSANIETTRIGSKGTQTAETLRATLDTGIYTFNVNNNTLGDTTPTSYWSVLAWGRGSAGSAELAASWTSSGVELYFRSLRDVTDNWWAWKEIIHSSNYTDYTVTKTGTGASGTWAINTSGSAASAPLLSALSNYVWSASTLPTGYGQGIQTSFVQSSNGFQNYGSVMTMNTYSGGGGALQLYVPYSPTYGGTGLQVRFGNFDVSTGNSWTSWKTLLASDNYNSYAPTLTGTGASGNWGINITGDAGSVDGKSFGTFTAAGGILYATSTIAAAATAAGTSGQALISNGAAAPAWQELTLAHLPGAWVKRSVDCATTAALTLNTAQTTIDGVTISSTSRVLVKNQATASQNGIYTGLTTTTWVRATDADTSGELAGGTIAVEGGTTNGGSVWTTGFKVTDTLGTTAMNWYIVYDGSTTVPVTNGGTGVTTLTGLAYGNGTSAMTAATAAQIVAAIGSTAVASATNAGTVTNGVYTTGDQTIGGVKTFSSKPQSAGLSTSWGVTSTTQTGAYNATMGTSTSATWLLSGTSGGVFRAGIQALDSDGTLRFYQGANQFSFSGGTVTATTFSGALSGNATTATTLQTARTINDVSFNGSANISISRLYEAGGGGNYLSLASGNELEFFNSSGVIQPLYLQYSGDNSSLRGPGGNIILNASNYTGYSTFSQVVIASQAGFQSATYSTGRNRIWSFANSDAYGISYFQGTGGYGGTDSVGIHFGTATTAGSQFTFRNNGDFISTGSVTSTAFYYSSDERKKKNIVKIQNALSKVRKIGGVEFDWRVGDKHDAGVIAQRVKEHFTPGVAGSEDDLKVNPQAMIGLLMEAVSELADIVLGEHA